MWAWPEFTASFPAWRGWRGLTPWWWPITGASTLPAVVAGLVEAPVIGLPVSTGYGLGGGGEAALYSMLQSCSVLTVVNIDAGFVAGAYAAKIARRKALYQIWE
ncbi:MAG TPA: AIR carboxylase family protein [Methanothrix sp.]|nr:AIR carboxylase family protein [Methanothrix sp.]